ncbi:MAG: PUR family DNA/RNA-binding protein [Bacteroidales bacterium]|nr:DUF3276 family protein [Candidatus Cryptobacteroides faecihippi]MCQ2162990.1 PUR family DNA/RNA-binding protein [Bacteroidales bacterium]
MYKDDSTHRNPAERGSEDVYSKPVRAGKRTYFFDVKSTKDSSDYFLTITESKRRTEQDGSFSFDKHKIFLYKEDFDKFQEGLEDALAYIKANLLTDEPSDNPESRFTDISFDDIK